VENNIDDETKDGPETVSVLAFSHNVLLIRMAFMFGRTFSCTCALLATLTLPLLAGSPEGIKNFNQVDMHVYRGAQPSDVGFHYLAKIGVKTVIDLREPGARSEAEKKTVVAAGMNYVNVPMTGLTPPTGTEIDKILGILESTDAGPVFVHCMRGADRTGAVIAAYRIDHDHWDNIRALSEAKSLGMSFFQLPRMSFIRNFQAGTVEAKAPVQDAGRVMTDGGGIQPVAPETDLWKNHSTK
jgi:tyrosine-protein phosphatase SIW14